VPLRGRQQVENTALRSETDLRPNHLGSINSLAAAGRSCHHQRWGVPVLSVVSAIQQQNPQNTINVRPKQD